MSEVHILLGARPGRFELPTPGFVGRCSIQLSYGRRLWVIRLKADPRCTRRTRVCQENALSGAPYFGWRLRVRGESLLKTPRRERKESGFTLSRTDKTRARGPH